MPRISELSRQSTKRSNISSWKKSNTLKGLVEDIIVTLTRDEPSSLRIQRSTTSTADLHTSTMQPSSLASQSTCSAAPSTSTTPSTTQPADTPPNSISHKQTGSSATITSKESFQVSEIEKLLDISNFRQFRQRDDN
ncbi:unnamed protein product [Lepeophtheirus salmonis]|uniref:(salmon louse) hypothetical protein n=1 Tax=Lepeophtheirus salmonis TaxID=72036 RepID=A0A7R8HE59_LEPSM|nr:unnamed protein product [Lepeophtheirus salmonis]CAF3042401.1 unnamed protein product [Lepeophtheirus salmonis]